MSALLLYKYLIKNVPLYPSKNKFELFLTVKEEFRDKKNLTDFK